MFATDSYLAQLLRKLGASDFTIRTADFLFGHVLKIAIILLVALVATRIATRVVRRSITGLVNRAPLRTGARAELRAATLAGVLASLTRVVVWTMATLLVIEQLGFNLGPFIAGASVIGVALGFGAQSLVKDFLSGFFILVEDQYGVGDVVNLGDAAGTVEEVNLRVTRVRSFDGTVWYVPNGEIKKVGNTSKEWSRAVVDLIVGLSTDISAAVAAIDEEMAALTGEQTIADGLLDAPVVLGVDAVGADSLTIRVAARVRPERRVAIERAMRARATDRLRRGGHTHAPEQLVVP
jgi:small conductance mechanosensitive channel